MDTEEMLAQVIDGAPCTGPFGHDELLGRAESGRLTGVVLSSTKASSLYLAFRNGVPTGAIFMDRHGPLYGTAPLFARWGARCSCSIW